ncbi:ran-binding protein 10-like [Clavelina lepadiformis]|uniref:Ran-binding protein 9 n=1 Tax=Clavelina lepadiformis TaxID=159417 RepID=A0ABP0F6H4_CLALP
MSLAHKDSDFSERLKDLYPAVNEDETPLPREWSPRDKHSYIVLSQDNLNARYQGQGKNHKDAASVRATHPIPPSCGIFYFEVMVVCKGRDGYMGIGLSSHGVKLNRLPGWEKSSYGYHGDDGHSFCATGTGQPYGPTFTTGDVIGCGLNVIDNSCFYTKNGVHIGIAFRDLSTSPLYPTIGLQTPNEELSVNFGQYPFLFEFEEYLKEWKNSVRLSIGRYVIQDNCGQFQTILHRLISSYLIHQGYVASTEAFNKSVNQGLDHYEDIASIKNRQKIQQLVLTGRLGEAIETTQQLFPGLLARNPNLMFRLKVRQFIEIINGTESEVKSLTRNLSVSSSYNSPVMSPKHNCWNKSSSSSPVSSHNGFSPPLQRSSGQQAFRTSDQRAYAVTSSSAGVFSSSDLNNKDTPFKSVVSSTSDSESDMETDSDDGHDNKTDTTNGVVRNGVSDHINTSNGITVEASEYSTGPHKALCGGNPIAVELMMQFGQQLLKFSKEITPEHANAKNKTILKDAYSLLAYTDPWSSPVGYQLDPVQREQVCSALNSEILQSQNLPKWPPLLTVIGQAQQCVKKMLSSKMGTAAFVSVSDYFH